MPPLFDDETAAAAKDAQLSRLAKRRRPRVRWTDTDGAREHAIDARVVIGSASHCDVVVRDPTVSRLHAEIEPRDDGVWLRDLGSKNGTYVDGLLVTGARLPDATTVLVGGTSLRVESTGETSEIELWPHDRFGPLVGRSAAMRELFARLAAVARTESTVFIQGETGTGKELIARAIHDFSPRAGGPFVVVDCGSLSDSLLEAELFGHARGAFTGAVAARAGAIESGDGGTVFLDEIGELPLAMQPKLLRALESRSVRRVGETAYRDVDVRFISATHRDLRTMVNSGAFREDLYFRLAVIPVTAPPLRSHLDDLPRLVEHFVPKGHAKPFPPEFLRDLLQRPWLGNVRELRNVVERAVALGPSEVLSRDAGVSIAPPPPAPTSSVNPVTLATSGVDASAVSIDEPFKDVRDRLLDQLERQYVGGLLARHAHNVSAVASAAGLNRGYVHRLIKKHGL